MIKKGDIRVRIEKSLAYKGFGEVGCIVEVLEDSINDGCNYISSYSMSSKNHRAATKLEIYAYSQGIRNTSDIGEVIHRKYEDSMNISKILFGTNPSREFGIGAPNYNIGDIRIHTHGSHIHQSNSYPHTPDEAYKFEVRMAIPDFCVTVNSYASAEWEVSFRASGLIFKNDTSLSYAYVGYKDGLSYTSDEGFGTHRFTTTHGFRKWFSQLPTSADEVNKNDIDEVFRKSKTKSKGRVIGRAGVQCKAKPATAKGRLVGNTARVRGVGKDIKPAFKRASIKLSVYS